MSHHCHATGCTCPIAPELLMCRKHWFMVPPEVRRRVWATYRRGQCDDMRPSADYCKAAMAAVEHVALKEGRAPDTRLYEMFLSTAGQPQSGRE